MEYLAYMMEKLRVNESTAIVSNAVTYLGNESPVRDQNRKGYEIVDLWLEAVKVKWNIEIKYLDSSQTKVLGKLVPKNGGFIVYLNKNMFKTKIRFTFAHEIAHIISYNTDLKWPVYAVRHSKPEEYYCDKIARAILLPQSLIDYGKLNLMNLDAEQVEYIKQLWKEYQVSPWQIILKLFDDMDNTNIVCIQWEHVKKESCLRIIEYCHPGNIFIPKKDRVHLGDLLTKKETNRSPEIAFNTNSIYSGFDLIEIGSLYKKKLFSTAFPIKTSAADYVIQIIKI